MFNFKTYNYDIIADDYLTIQKNLTRTVFNEHVQDKPYIIVKEYINPKFNSFLPKDYVFNERYYVYSGLEDKYVRFNNEYFNHFENQRWTAQEIYTTLSKNELSKYKSNSKNHFYKDMVGIRPVKIFYLLALSGIIFALFYNFVSNPWNNEFVGDNNLTVVSNELKSNSNNNAFYVNMNDDLLNEFKREESSDWKKLKPQVNVAYSYCSVPNSSISYILVEDKNNQKEASQCKGKGVVKDITYPIFTKPINEFLPDNIITRDNLNKDELITYQEGIKKIAENYNIDVPKFVIYKNAKVISQQDINVRKSLLVLATLLPIISGIYLIVKQKKFKAKLESIRKK
jgi:hypothetical protein